MLKNYKPYGELDLTDDGYLFDTTTADFTTIIASLVGQTEQFELASATDLLNHEIKSTLDLTTLKEQIKCKKFNKITCKFKIENDIYTATLNKIGDAFIITASVGGGITVTIELLIDTEILYISLNAANLVLE